MHFKAAALVLIAGVSAALVASAATPSPSMKGARHAALAPAAPIWVTDKAASRLTFRGAVSGQNFDGVFKKWDAQIAFDPKDLKASHATVTIDIGSVVTGDPTRDQMLPTPDWFSAQKFPQATFITSAITQTGPDHYQAIGDLKIRGASRHVVMPFTLSIVKDIAKMDGSLTINRGEFGIGQGQFASPDTVAANVTIMVRLTAKQGR
jgi:polyisoprenoid-binding protein YceI